MPRIILLALLLSVLVIGGGPAYAQEPPDEGTQEEAPESEATAQPEIPKHISTVMVEGNRLSVEFANVSFGEILRSISQKAGFQIEGSSPVFSKQITTKFTDLDLDKGIIRLFSLVKENNYFISYDAKGAIALVKIPTAKAGGKTYSTAPVAPRSQGTIRQRRIFRRPGVPGAPAAAPQPESPQPEENEAPPDE